MLNPDFKEMLSWLKGEEVEFIIVGAYASALNTCARAD
jgi:2-hydroxy-3-keto-5-methylthiopentenyl-1-phosphate phosphatase